MRNVDLNQNLHPYGPMRVGDSWHITYIPEMRVLEARRDTGVPMSVLTPIMDTMNMHVRAGQSTADVEAMHQGLLDDAARAL